MAKAKILIQLDTDPQPSTFDGVVAIDAGVEQLLRHGAVTRDNVRDLVYGAIFTRGPDELQSTALFVGGSNVAAGEALLAAIQNVFFGPMRVSVMLDSNGANTTAAAAVLAAGRHVPLAGAAAAVLAGTGPVGSRACRLLASEGAAVRICSRSRARAEAVCEQISPFAVGPPPTAHECHSAAATQAAIAGAAIVIAAGAPGVELLSAEGRRGSAALRVAIDLSAVSPLGIGGIAVADRAVERNGAVCYGAVGVGGRKMKIHRAAVAQLFAASDQVLDAAEIYAIGRGLES